ncbi:MAG TPA: replicative helicase loader/inhibitor [Kofleriaceae bacterium]|nr:replicative helicase loader/inhibitor [Kofleriaceae bacterium]
MTNTEITQALKLIFAAYPQQRARMSADDVKAMHDVWSLAFADVSLEPAKAAIARHVCTSKWMPSIAEIREQLGTLHHGLKRSGINAWGDLKALRTYREREAMEQVDPVVLFVCRAFDWIEWRTLLKASGDIEQWHVVVPLENEASDRARFAELYDKTIADERTTAQLSAGGKIPAQLQRSRDGRQLGDIVSGLLPEKT